MLQHSGVNLSAHQTIEAEYEEYGSIAQLAAELETIAAAAQQDRFADLLRGSGLTDEQHAAVVESTAFGPLTATLRRAEANHHDLERLLPRIIGRHRLDDADDVAAVLRHRLEKVAASRPRGNRAPTRLIAGLIPEPLGPMTTEDRRAIADRATLIESRARVLAEEAVDSGQAWASRLGKAPSEAGARERWLAEVVTVAAYRDRYRIASDLPVGRGADSDAQKADRDCALLALRRARAVVTQGPERRSSNLASSAIAGP